MHSWKKSLESFKNYVRELVFCNTGSFLPFRNFDFMYKKEWNKTNCVEFLYGEGFVVCSVAIAKCLFDDQMLNDCLTFWRLPFFEMLDNLCWSSCKSNLSKFQCLYICFWLCKNVSVLIRKLTYVSIFVVIYCTQLWFVAFQP